MKNFLFGILFILIILIAISFLKGVIALFNQEIEYLCTCIAVKEAKKQLEVSQEEEEEPVNTHCIGFQISNDDYYDEDEE